MAKRAIAAMLLLAMAAWAEIALAPMLAMRAMHVHAHHANAATSGKLGHQHDGHAMAKEMPCCPGRHKASADAMPVFIAVAPGCDDSHKCCFRQGPQSVPAPVRDSQRLERQTAPAVVANISAPPARESHAEQSTLLTLPPYPEIFGMALRV